MDMFTTRKMLPMLTDEVRAKSFLRDRYFGNVVTFDTERIDIDIVGPGQRRMAPFVNPKVGGKTVERAGYRTESYKAPEVSPDMITTAEDMLKRSPGETIYNAESPQRRAAKQLAKDLGDLDDIITRREEWMCAQALFTGKIDIKGEGYDEVLQYWPTETGDQPTTTLATKWDDSNANPLKDLRLITQQMVKDSGLTPVECIMGADAYEAFLSLLETNQTWAKFWLDFGRVDGANVRPNNLPNGVRALGNFNGLNILAYDEWYVDENGTEQPMVPLNKVLVACRGVRTTMAYGLVSLFSENRTAPEFVAGARVPDSWNQRKNPAGRIVQIKSRPLPIIHQIYGFHVFDAVDA